MIATIKPHTKTAVIAVKDKVEDSPWTKPRNNAEAADYCTEQNNSLHHNSGSSRP